jgi:hypothetical protein
VHTVAAAKLRIPTSPSQNYTRRDRCQRQAAHATPQLDLQGGTRFGRGKARPAALDGGVIDFSTY